MKFVIDAKRYPKYKQYPSKFISKSMWKKRPYTTVVLAMSADGKIADFQRSPARFGSNNDKIHLEKQIAAVDAVIFGAGTLRAYGTTLTITEATLLQQRILDNKQPQPVHIVISQSADLDPDIKFFQQPIRRWLLTTSRGANLWEKRPEFEKVLIFENPSGEITLVDALEYLVSLEIHSLAILGGGDLVGSFFQDDLIDELWLTICPLILGSNLAPTPVHGKGFLANAAPKLQLLAVSTMEQEVFLHYRLQKNQENI